MTLSIMEIKKQPLPIAPVSLFDVGGQLHQGQFAGATGNIDWSHLASPLKRSAWWRHFHHKRWMYVALVSEDYFCAVALVDIGWTSTAFAYVFDRRVARVVAGFSQDGLPGLGARLAQRCGDGAEHHFQFGRHRVDICHVPTRCGYSLRLRSPGFEVDAEFADAHALLLAVGPVAGGVAHATQKSSGLALSGELRLEDERHSLNGGVASFDYSNGLLARETSWRWASAHSLTLGFNLQNGYFGDQENALWLDGQIFPLGTAIFEFDEHNPMAPWHISTADGLVDLEFVPQGVRRENKNLWLAASRYVQPIGLFHGVVQAAQGSKKETVRGMMGVTEDHQSRW
jgi:hypothetical protein